MIIFSTSRNPTQKIRTLSNSWANSLPHAQRLTRGSMNRTILLQKCIKLNANRLITLSRFKGNPGIWNVFFIKNDKLTLIKQFKITRFNLVNISTNKQVKNPPKIQIVFKGQFTNQYITFFKYLFNPIKRNSINNICEFNLSQNLDSFEIFVKEIETNKIISPIFYLKEIGKE